MKKRNYVIKLDLNELINCLDEHPIIKGQKQSEEENKKAKAKELEPLSSEEDIPDEIPLEVQKEVILPKKAQTQTQEKGKFYAPKNMNPDDAIKLLRQQMKQKELEREDEDSDLNSS